MAKRRTIMIDEDLDRKLRLIQSKKIHQSKTTVSYSQVINEIIRRGLIEKR